MAPVGGQKRCAWQRPKFRRRKVKRLLFSDCAFGRSSEWNRRRTFLRALNAIILGAYYNSLSFLCSFNNRPVSHVEEGLGKC